MEIMLLIILSIFIAILVLDKIDNQKDEYLRTNPSMFYTEDDVDLNISLEAEKTYIINSSCIISLRATWPHEDVQRECDYLNQCNESIYRQRIPNAVKLEEFKLLFENMHLRFNISREEFRNHTGF